MTPGYRSVPLKNSYNEDLELASLLVHMDMIRGRVSCRTLLSLFETAVLDVSTINKHYMYLRKMTNHSFCGHLATLLI